MSSNLHSVMPDAAKLVSLRHRLGWTQQEAAAKAGYSDRLIRKVEKPLPVRPQTLRDVVQCYLSALGDNDIDIDQFIGSNQITHLEATSLDQNNSCRFVERMHDYYNVVYQQREIDRIEEFACPYIRFTSEGVSRAGIDAIRQRASLLLASFNPIEFTIDRSFSHNQIVVSYWSVRMKHVGVFFEIPATNRWVNVRGNSIVEFAEDLVVEGEDQFDVDDLVRQLTGQGPRVI
jgi:predicted ester cyclase/DNA-binding XRE family transcriptional regulator